jgi:hypothetical protein
MRILSRKEDNGRKRQARKFTAASIAAVGLVAVGALGLSATSQHARSALPPPAEKGTATRLPARERPAVAVRGYAEDPSNGVNPDLQIDVVPDAVLLSPSGKEALEYHLELSTRACQVFCVT